MRPNYEADSPEGNFATYLMRSFLSEGKVRYDDKVVTSGIRSIAGGWGLGVSKLA